MNGRWILGSFIFRVNMILGGKQTTIFPFFPFLSFSVFFFFYKRCFAFLSLFVFDLAPDVSSWCSGGWMGGFLLC